MASIHHSAASCGISEVSSLNESPQEILDQILKDRTNQPRKQREAFVTWSDIHYDATNYLSRGQRLHDYIAKEYPRTMLWQSEVMQNPNTLNKIRMFVWAPPWTDAERHENLMPCRGFRRAGDPGYKMTRYQYHWGPENEYRVREYRREGWKITEPGE